MKAIAGLAQSMKDGVLTEQKLMEMVSDIGGKLRTSQLLALIQNWDMYESMLGDYANAVGSADREIENALDSWTRKTNVLKNTWTEFISNLVETDQIKGVLDALIATVERLDTDSGRATVTFAATSVALYGIAAAVKSIKAAAAALDITKLNPWVLGLSAVATVLGLVWKETEDSRKSIDELSDGIESNNQKLEENQTRLHEINLIPWNEKTTEILAERDALERENDELQAQIEKYKELKKERAEETLNNAYRATTTYSDQRVRGEIVSTPTTTILEGADYFNLLTRELNTYSRELQKNKQISDEHRQAFAQTRSEAVRMAQAIDAIGYKNATEEQKKMYDALRTMEGQYDTATNYINDYVAALFDEQRQAGATATEINKLISEEIAANRQQLNFSQQIQALQTLATQAGYTASVIATVFSIDETSMLNQIRASANGLMQAGKAKTSEQAMQMAKADYINALWGNLAANYKPENNPTSTYTGGSGSSSGGNGKSGSTKDEELESLKETVALKKSELELMQKQGKPAEQQVAKMREIQLALHEQADYMRSIGAAQSDINALSSEWFDWNEKILNTQKELWNELQEAVNKKLEEAADARDEEIAKIDEQIEALKKQKEIADDALTLEEKKAAVLEKQKALLDAQNERNVRVFNSASGQWEWQANRKTVQSAKEAYDKAKDDLEKFKEDLEREARIDELEAEKEKLKAKYDDLQSQWDKIIDAMAEPVRSITDILKDIATNATPELKKQIIENKDLFKALGVDVEELSDEFSKTAILSRMQRRSNAWFMTDDEDEKNALYEQNKADAKLLGLTEKNGSYYWEDGTLAYQTSLQGGGAQNNQVNQELNGNQNQQGTTGGSSSGGGGSNGWTLADGSDANLNYKDTTPYPNGVKPSVKGADMSRDTKWAGKTVEKNGYVISYDEDGYAKSATNIRIGSLNEDLANKYPHVDADGNQMYKPGVTDNPKTGKDYYYDTGTSSSGSSSSGKGSSSSGSSGGSSSSGKNNSSGSYTGTSSGGGTYTVGSDKGKDFVSNAKPGSTMKGSDGSTWTKNKDGTTTISKNGKDYTVSKYDSGGVLHGLGGIKATVQDEIVLPPDVTKKMLDPDANSVFQKRLGELRWLYQKGSGSSASEEIARTVNNRESHDHYGDSYSINGIRMEPARAERMTIRELAEASRALGVYGN